MTVPLDFSLGLSPPFVEGSYLRHGRVSVLRGLLRPDGDELFEARQVITALHIRPVMRLEWRVPPGESQSRGIRQGMVHVSGAGRIVQWRWAESAEMVVIAIDPILFADVAAKQGAAHLDIGTVVGVFDWKIRHLANLCERELRDGGCNGRLYLESLGTALTVHLIRHYGQSRRSLGSARGGIAPARLRHVLDYIGNIWLRTSPCLIWPPSPERRSIISPMPSSRVPECLRIAF